MGYSITMNENGLPSMTYDQDTTIMSDLALSIAVRKGSFFLDPNFGLRELPKKSTDQNIELIKQYFFEAWKWLITAGRAKSIDVIAERDDDEPGRVNVKATAVQANDKIITFETFVAVV